MNRLPSLVFAYNLCFYRVSNISWLLFLYDCQTVNRMKIGVDIFWIANGINRIMSRIKNRSSLFLNSESNRIWFGKKIQKICYRHHALIRIKVSWISVWIWIPAPRLILKVQFHRKLTGNLTKAGARMKARYGSLPPKELIPERFFESESLEGIKLLITRPNKLRPTS